MNRNSILTGVAAVVAIVGGVYLASRLRQRALPTGEMTQASPTAETGAIAASPIPGTTQVQIVTTKGSETIVLNLSSDAQLLGKLSRGECDGKTLAQCGVSAQNLSAEAVITSSTVLSK